MKEDYSLPDEFKVEITKGTDIQKKFKITGNEFGPEIVARFYDAGNNRTWGYIVVDNLARGNTTIGGTRIAKDVTVQEIYGLASAMTLKSAGAMLPYGGGKSGIIAPAQYFIEHLQEKEKLMVLFLRWISST